MASKASAVWTGSLKEGKGTISTATGVLNTGGNLAGFLAPVVGVILDRFGWLPTLASGSVFAVIAALLWLLVRVQVEPSR